MPIKVALFTDTLDEMNGVSRFIRDMGQRAADNGCELTIVTCSAKPRFELPYRVNFEPLYTAKLPYYPDIPMVIPPAAKIHKWAAECKPDVLEISTPGAMGLLGLRVGRKLKVPMLGVYHTDFPAFVRDITGNRLLTAGATKFMSYFYGKMHKVFSRTSQYFPMLEKLGVPRENLLLTLPSVDLAKFTHTYRDEALWQRMGVKEPHRILFCGRVSREKNMPMLVDMFLQISKRRSDIALVVAGFGPYLTELQRRLEGTRVYYQGYLTDPELATLYASSDLYIFPSLTDTLGQVILESQACGTPVLVSDMGGPKEVVQDGVTGLVLPGRDLNAWVRAIEELIDQPERRQRMSQAAIEYVQQFGQRKAFLDFWNHFELAASQNKQAVPA